MGAFLEKLLRPQALNLMDDRYWSPASSRIGATAYSGVNVSPETALMSSAVWACVRHISEDIARIPLIIYQRQADGGKSRAAGHPLYTVLHDDPNALQTAFTWKRSMMVQALLYGGGYSRIVPGPRGAVDQLVPIFADDIRPEKLAGGGRRWQVRGENGIEQPVNDEDIFHIPGLSIDGFNGLGLVQYARESIGLSLAAGAYVSTFYKNGASAMGGIKSPGKLDDVQYNRLREQVNGRLTGPQNWHRPMIVEGGDWIQMGMTHQDAELIAQLDWSHADIARFFNVPLHMIQLMTKETSWGSGIEELGMGYVTYTIMPWAVNWEQMVSKRLILAPQYYFAEFLLESLMRGKLLDRYGAYKTGRDGGWLSVNEIRGFENLNPVDGGDDYGTAPTAPPAFSPPQNQTAGHYHLLLHQAATRIVRRETAAMSKAAKRCSGCAADWESAVAEFYGEHAAFICQTICLSRADADSYVETQTTALLKAGASVLETWESGSVAALVALALGQAQEDTA